VIMHTSTASIGVRGSGALINVPDGGAKSTAVFMHGKDMVVECTDGCQGETQTVTRPGSAIDFARGLLSAPYLAKADLIKAIQAGFEKPSGLGEIAPAAGPGSAGGGGSIDDQLAQTNIGNTNSSTPPAPPPSPPTDTQLSEVASDAVSDATSSEIQGSQTPPPPSNGGGSSEPPPPPPPPPPAPTGSFTEGRIARSPVGSGFVNTTLAFTPNPDNYGPIVSAAATNPNNGPVANNAITLSTEEILNLPYVAGSFSWVTTSGDTQTPIDAGFGFVAADNSFFRYWGIEFPFEAAPRSFEIFGGTPTETFPTTGFATHQVLPLFGTEVGDIAVNFAILPFLNSDLLNTDPNVLLPIVFDVGQPGVTVSPLYSAYATVPVNGQMPASDARPVTFQASLAILGSGPNQQSLIMGGTGTFYRETATADVTMTGTAVGSYRPGATG